ncbi:MAG: hypothetical protein CMA00_004825 [Methanobacteriota archaeon]|nr:MAG: hypothetical protein CMA00_004825 [Euryarchaeota archaeon]
MSDIGLWHQTITPHDVQNLSLLDSSIFIFCSPQEGHLGADLDLTDVILGGLGLLLLGTAQPFLGLLIFGTINS